jgi:hypothetical protein
MVREKINEIENRKSNTENQQNNTKVGSLQKDHQN